MSLMINLLIKIQVKRMMVATVMHMVMVMRAWGEGKIEWTS